MVGASSIISETFGKVAHPPLRLKRDTNRKDKKKGLMIVMCHYTMAKRRSFLLIETGLQHKGIFRQYSQFFNGAHRKSALAIYHKRIPLILLLIRSRSSTAEELRPVRTPDVDAKKKTFFRHYQSIIFSGRLY